MHWLGLAPMLAHICSSYLFFRIATIPAGYWRWWIGWGVLSCGTAFYAWGRAENVINVAWYGHPFDLTRTLTASVGATCTLIFALCLRHIFKPRPAPIPVPVAQVIMDYQGLITSWNQAATALLGWTEEEALRQELATLMIPEWLMIDHHGEQIPAREAHRLGLQHFRMTGESAIMNTSFVTTALHKDGRGIDVEVRVTSHMSAMRQTFMGQLTPKPKLVM